MHPPMADLAHAFHDHWRRHFAPVADGPVVIGVSGGRDSMALLALLARDAAGGDGLPVVAAHFDHGTRAAESAADGRFVAAVAERWGARVVLGAGDAPAAARAAGRGPQAAARRLRYRFLRDVARREGAPLLTAHQRDDRVETVLLRLVRGASPDGLAGPRPVDARDGVVLLRPLLAFSRRALDGWITRTGVPFRDDPSNVDPRYARTRVRRDVVPQLTRLNPRVDEAIVRLAAQAAADAAFLDSAARDVLADAEEDTSEGLRRYAAKPLLEAPDPLLTRAVILAWAATAPAGRTPPGAAWVGGTVAFLRRGRGGAVPAPGGGFVRRRGGTIEFRGPHARDEAAR